MQERYWMFRRDNGVYYLEDRTTRRQESLKTKDKGEARQLLAARNQAAANGRGAASLHSTIFP